MADKTKKIGHLAVEQWQVRDENGSIFGPVEFDALKSWVEDGRVSPVSEVSSDGKKWILAVLIEELEMNCVAEIESGSFYGPIHRRAMGELIAAGSIPADAIIYCKESGREQPHEISQTFEGVAQSEHDAVLAKLGDAESQIQSLCKELAAVSALYNGEQQSNSELTAANETLEQELAQLGSQGANDQALIESLQGEVARSATLVESLQGAVARAGTQVESLQGEIEAYKAEFSKLQSASEEIIRKSQDEISSLNTANGALKCQVDVLVGEQVELRAEAEALRRSNSDQLQLMEERERIYTSELKDKLKALQSVNLALADEHSKTAATVKAFGAASVKEHATHLEEISAKQREINVLAQRIDELEQRNRELKEDFVQYKGLKSSTSANESAERRLIVMKNLFAEAARLLEDVESPVESSVVEELGSVRSEQFTEVCEPELLDYEEVTDDKFERPSVRSSVSWEPVKEEKKPKNNAENTKTSALKDEKKWPFGKGRANLGHESLAELEAQARIELQRLSSTNDLSALFDKKK